MDIIISKSDLVKTLSHLYRVVEKKSPMPVLSNVKIEADGKLIFTATNTDLEIQEVVVGNINESGATTIPVHLFYDIVKKLPESSDVEIKTFNENSVKIKAGNSEFTLPTLPAADFPVMSLANMPHKFKIQTADLIKLIDKTRFAMSNEETRYFLNGIFFHTIEKDGNKLLRAVATDGHRLALQDVVSPDGTENMQGIIVPRKVINELRSQLDTAEDDVNFETSDTKAVFKFGNTTIISKLIDGKFPDYEKVIPSVNDKTLEVDCELFSQAVDRVSSVAFEKSKAIKVEMMENKMVLSASAPDSGSAKEDLVISYNSESMDIGFNALYLLDITKQIEGKFMKFLISDQSSPVIIEELDNKSSLFVLMPMRI